MGIGQILALRKGLLAALLVFVFTSGYSQKYINTFSKDIPPGSLRLVEVKQFFMRSDVVNEKKAYSSLLKLGIQDEEIVDGRFGMGTIYCCGGTAEGPTRQIFYIPNEMIGQVKVSDMVEIRNGMKPVKGHERTEVNTLLRIVQRADANDSTVRWVPNNPRLWMRVLYADWMEKEGWIELKKAIDHTWYKPPATK